MELGQSQPNPLLLLEREGILGKLKAPPKAGTTASRTTATQQELVAAKDILLKQSPRAQND